MNTMKNKYIAQLGSNWNNWDNAGSFYWNLNNSVGNRNRNIRGHLVNCKVQPGFNSPADSINCGNLSTVPLGKKEK